MKHSLQLKLSQHLTLTPQLQQSIKLLQLSTVELNQELERYLTDNPLLERIDIPGDDVPLGMNGAPPQTSASGSTSSSASESGPDHDASNQESPDFGGSDDGFGVMRSRPGGEDGEDGEFNQLAAAEPTLQEHLLQQLQLIPLPQRDRELAGLIIAHLDEDGYCTQDLAELHAMVIEELEDVEPDDLSIALKHVQNLEPTGVGARNLAECLILQLKALPEDLPGRDLALKLASSHLDVLGARDFNKLKRLLSCDETELKQVRELILTLDPKPGRNFGQGDVRYVVPDVLVKKVNGKWTAMLNQDAMPKLRINKMYADILQASRDTAGKNLAGQLQEARWLIKNVQQRFDTILRVTQAIVDRQRHFFEHGEVAMRPLVLREIADQVGLHESTISRVTTQKYMLTSRGLFELKYFFGSSVSTDTGGACSATAIRALIKQLVGAEDGKKPLSDNRIADILAQQGIVVARRTVAKYRESMQIQPANLRKSL
ncbi:MAG: RNA polymerase factor sigma-54 [Burkholderiales bacterium]|nr:RNA polymerase factor sigma-54 [Burkholderiales bacterium]